MKFLLASDTPQVLNSPESMAQQIRDLVAQINAITEEMAAQKVEVKFSTSCNRHPASGEWQWILTTSMNKKEYL